MPDVSAPQDLVPDYFPRTVREKHHLSFEACVSDTSSDVTSAEIEWIPNHARFTQRSKLSSHKPYSGHLLPDAWPKAVQGPLAWTGNELHDEEFIYELSEGDRHEIEHATRAFKGKPPEYACSPARIRILTKVPCRNWPRIRAH